MDREYYEITNNADKVLNNSLGSNVHIINEFVILKMYHIFRLSFVRT